MSKTSMAEWWEGASSDATKGKSHHGTIDGCQLAAAGREVLTAEQPAVQTGVLLALCPMPIY